MSCTRSRTSRTTALRTPRPATVTSIRVSRPARASMMTTSSSAPSVPSRWAVRPSGSSACWSASAYPLGSVPSATDTSQAVRVVPAPAWVRTSPSLLPGSKTSPTIVSGQGRPVAGEGERVPDLAVGGPQHLGGDDGLSRAGEPASRDELVADPAGRTGVLDQGRLAARQPGHDHVRLGVPQPVRGAGLGVQRGRDRHRVGGLRLRLRLRARLRHLPGTSRTAARTRRRRGRRPSGRRRPGSGSATSPARLPT